MERVFDDLFAYDSGGLCHLQVFRSRGRSAFVCTELEDNPGPSLINGAESLARSLEGAFGSRSTRTFVRFLGEHGGGYEVVDALSGDRPAFRKDVSDQEIRDLVGAADITLLTEPDSAAKIGGDRHALLRLIPPPEPEPDLHHEFEVVSVADLPWPHNPSRCAHADRYSMIRDLYRPEMQGHVPAGAHWFLSLTTEDTASCPYHDADWQTIAAASVELLERLPPALTPRDLMRAASELVDGDEEQRELAFLFADPIVWTPGASSITNGQHRTCALKAAEAPLVVAATGTGMRISDPVPADPRRRAQSALAAYWARELGR